MNHDLTVGLLLMLMGVVWALSGMWTFRHAEDQPWGPFPESWCSRWFREYSRSPLHNMSNRSGGILAVIAGLAQIVAGVLFVIQGCDLARQIPIS